MAGKKNISNKQAGQQRPAAQQAHKPIVKNTGNNESFWKSLADDKAKRFLYQKIFIFLVAFLVFANGIPNGFNMDDTYYTTKENTVSNKGLKAIREVFTTHTLSDKTDNKFDYRPVAMLSFVIQHQFLGGAPAISHFINVLIYAFICLLVFVLLSSWLGDEKSWLALFIAVVYAVHPLHTEVVDNIKNRDELLATLFCMLSMLSFWKWYKTGKTGQIILAFFLFFVGLLCKRTIITYVAVVPMMFYFFTDVSVKKIVISSLVLGAALVFLSQFQKFALTAETKRTFVLIENPMYVMHVPLAIKSATASYVLGWYALLHVIPYPLSFYYGYRYVQLLKWSDLQPIISLIPYLFLLYLVVKNIRTKGIIAFGALVYLASIAPYANFLKPAPGMIAERFAFAATLGYCIVLVGGLYSVYERIFTAEKSRTYLAATLSLICIGYAAMTVARNTDWKNSLTLYSHDIAHLSSSGKANMLYGEELLSNNTRLRMEYEHAYGMKKREYRDSLMEHMDEEIAPFLRALAVDSNYSNALNNVAVAYINADSLELAKKYLIRSCTLAAKRSDNSVTHYNLAIVYGNLSIKGNNAAYADSSEKEFNSAIRINPQYAVAYQRLGQLYLKRHDTDGAINVLLRAAKNINNVSLPYIALAEVYLYKRDTVQAVSYYEKGAEVAHPDPALFRLLSSYYHSRNNIQKEKYYMNKTNMAGGEMENPN